jgi:hypothetical protein
LGAGAFTLLNVYSGSLPVSGGSSKPAAAGRG